MGINQAGRVHGDGLEGDGHIRWGKKRFWRLRVAKVDMAGSSEPLVHGSEPTEKLESKLDWLSSGPVLPIPGQTGSPTCFIFYFF